MKYKYKTSSMFSGSTTHSELNLTLNRYGNFYSNTTQTSYATTEKNFTTSTADSIYNLSVTMLPGNTLAITQILDENTGKIIKNNTITGIATSIYGNQTKTTTTGKINFTTIGGIEYTLTFYAGNYSARSVIVHIPLTGSLTQYVYLLPTALTKQYVVSVKTQESIAIPNATTEVFRKINGTSSHLISSGYTDGTGSIPFNLQPGQIYTIVVSKAGFTSQQTTYYTIANPTCSIYDGCILVILYASGNIIYNDNSGVTIGYSGSLIINQSSNYNFTLSISSIDALSSCGVIIYDGTERKNSSCTASGNTFIVYHVNASPAGKVLPITYWWKKAINNVNVSKALSAYVLEVTPLPLTTNNVTITSGANNINTKWTREAKLMLAVIIIIIVLIFIALEVKDTDFDGRTLTNIIGGITLIGIIFFTFINFIPAVLGVITGLIVALGMVITNRNQEGY